MKKINIFLVIIIGVVIFSSCRKEVVQPTATDSKKPQNMSELVASPSFDWKTTKDYQITLSGTFNEVVTIKSVNGIVFHKGFMKSNASYKLNITIPSSEKTVHLIYHGQDVECNLNQPIINYSFNTKKSIS